MTPSRRCSSPDFPHWASDLLHSKGARAGPRQRPSSTPPSASKGWGHRTARLLTTPECRSSCPGAGRAGARAPTPLPHHNNGAPSSRKRPRVVAVTALGSAALRRRASGLRTFVRQSRVAPHLLVGLAAQQQHPAGTEPPLRAVPAADVDGAGATALRVAVRGAAEDVPGHERNGKRHNPRPSPPPPGGLSGGSSAPRLHFRVWVDLSLGASVAGCRRASDHRLTTASR